MKENIKCVLEPNQFKFFEERVFNYLFIDPKLFKTCVKEHRGYALLLRIWIKEKFYNGSTALEVAKIIKKSKLCIETINIGNPLYMTAVS
ncbi:hypothetical protein [Aquimarina spinulae]|uniref:hypothetical protein n=1 Tax=Aquimarina spinulae TaxID=1192023 RepID=UPI000D553F48|nr:hypothetical protein [Aquimarina spinulae]